MSFDISIGDITRILNRLFMGLRHYELLDKSGYHPINTLDAAQMQEKLQWCDDNLERISKMKLHGDDFCAARDDEEWLTKQMAFLKRLILTLPNDKTKTLA